jgi:hypothetical protein
VRYALLIYDDDAEAPYVLAATGSATCVQGNVVIDGGYEGVAAGLRAFDVIEVETLDEAIEAAAGHAPAMVEIRPLEERP